MASSTDNRSLFEGVSVLHVGPHLPRKGGVSIQTHLTEDGLRSSGAKLMSIDTILHSISHPILMPLRMFLQPLVLACRFLGKAGKAKIIHLQACSWYGFIPVIVCAPLNKMFFKKRLVVTFHGARGHIFLRKYRAFAIPLMRMTNACVVVSPELQEAFGKYGIKTDVVSIIINLDAFRYRERPQIKPNIVWMRHLDEMYDPLTGLKVYEKVKAQLPEATLVMIGNGALRGELDQYIAEHALADIKFTGNLPHKQMAEEFDKADIFLNTSKNDAKPAALLEASAAGLPIVTTAAGGIPDMVSDGVDAVIAPVGDVEALADAVIDLLKNPDRAHALGQAARRNAEQYSWENYSKELSRLYALD